MNSTSLRVKQELYSIGQAAVGFAVPMLGLAGDVRKRTLASDFMVYGFAAAGILYLAQFWGRGTL